ncbi:MAG: hypothetical protein ACPG4T_09700 [Nannocystaceae bacterium]
MLATLFVVGCRGEPLLSGTDGTSSSGEPSDSDEPIPEPVTSGTTGATSTSDDVGTEGETGTDDHMTSEGETSETGEDPTETSATSEDPTGEPMITCAKVDVLFVIDNHSGGGGSLATLAQSIPGIAEEMEVHLGDRDVHAMVIDTDDIWGQSYCQQQCDQFGTCDAWPEYPCDVPLGECDETLGAGLVYPGISQLPCEVVPGTRYLEGPPQEFADALACLTDVGNHGNGVQFQAQAMVEALQPANDCNSGFLRDDAVLMVVLVSHAPDTLSIGTPESWISSVSQIKGSTEAVVMVGLLDDSHLPEGECFDPGGDLDLRLHQFVEGFPNHIAGSVCANSYEPYIEQGLELMGEICEVIGT